MSLNTYRLKGHIDYNDVDIPGEIEHGEIDVVIVSTEEDALILQEAINGGFNGDVNVFNKKTGEKIYW